MTHLRITSLRALRAATVAALAVLAATSASCRRDLYVYGDEFHSLQLNVDWRGYQDRDPDGMTVWFFATDDTTRAPYRFTTGQVRLFDFYLPRGTYTGVVVDYSPEEYSSQDFVGLDAASTAAVVARPDVYQPDTAASAALYGDWAYADSLPARSAATGLYIVSCQPEMMAIDTLSGLEAYSGDYGDYIPYDERDNYQQTLTVQTYSAAPTSPLWRLRIRIYIKGFDYLYQTEGSLAGLADGRLLARYRNTDTPCLVALTDWEKQRTGDNEGYISTTLTTFGLRASLRPHNVQPADTATRTVASTRADGAVDWADTRLTRPSDLRLNLRFLLRDRKTFVNYHFDVGEYVVSFDDQLVLRLDLDKDNFPPNIPDPDDPDSPKNPGGGGGGGDDPDDPNNPGGGGGGSDPDDPNNPGGGGGGGGGDDPDDPGIDLPYVDAYDGTGFSADVHPWEDTAPADVDM